MIPRFRAWLKQYNVMVDDVSDLTFFEGNLKFIGRRTVGGVSFQYSVDKIELMQSTGLKDENSKEIFEGDILEVTDKHSWLEVVSYSQEKVMFVTEEINREFKVPESPLYDLSDSTFLKFKVIGNIYENSELLEVE